MNREYITVKGQVKKYYYRQSESTKKPKCPNCSSATLKITMTLAESRIPIGYYCKHCEQMYIYNKFKVFLIKSNLY